MLAGYMLFRRHQLGTDASLARMPDLAQEAWRKRRLSAEEARQRAIEASRECLANGNRYVLIEDYPAALREFTKAAELDASNLDACLQLGRIAQLTGNSTLARDGWRRALRLDPLSTVAHAGMFDLLREGNEEDRRRAFRHALALHVLSPHRPAPREFILLHPDIAREIELVANDGGGESQAEIESRELLAAAWQTGEHRTADIHFGHILARFRAAEARSGS